ncbi:MAG: Glu-tRNA(Gln) amidotransferase subunit GatE [Candidatus Pacearchaeota archaeon]|jgi:Glu-tRNA(Gln) amidotransferase subunit E-like FAD-binding protein
MEDDDYEEFGFKSGLEIHQQLDTRKLFCNCPSILRVDEPDFEIKRKLHAVAGEAGEVDIAAKHEAEQLKEFIYQGYEKSTCLVELDEEPPHEINKEALKIAISIALLLNCDVLPISQIMRKTVIDGSNTSGFQRTVMIAQNGFIETSLGKVGIDGIYLEEDSARIIGKELDKYIYRIDRLGIPLVEIATKPDLKNARHVKETALKIGELLRSCKVKRGIGTIRQDVNISIKGSNRVEIKGFQDPKIMEKCIELEVLRQQNFLDKKQKNPSEVRNCLPDGTTEFLRPMPGKSRMYPETDVPLLKISRSFIDDVKKVLPKLRDEIKEELQAKGLNEEMIKLLLKERKVDEFKELLKIIDNPKLIVKVLLLFPKEIATKENKKIEKIEKILEDNYNTVLELFAKNKILESDIKECLTRIVRNEKIDDLLISKRVEDNNLEEKIMNLIKEKPGLSENAYMGLIMRDFKGQINAKNVMDLIKKYLK